MKKTELVFFASSRRREKNHEKVKFFLKKYLTQSHKYDNI